MSTHTLQTQALISTPPPQSIHTLNTTSWDSTWTLLGVPHCTRTALASKKSSVIFIFLDNAFSSPPLTCYMRRWILFALEQRHSPVKESLVPITGITHTSSLAKHSAPRIHGSVPARLFACCCMIASAYLNACESVCDQFWAGMCAAVIKQHNASLSVARGLTSSDANTGAHWAQHEVDLVPFHQAFSGSRNNALSLSLCTLFSSFLLSLHSTWSLIPLVSVHPFLSSLLSLLSFYIFHTSTFSALLLLIYIFLMSSSPFLFFSPNCFFPLSYFLLIFSFVYFHFLVSSLFTTISTLLLLSCCPLFSHLYSCLSFFLLLSPIISSSFLLI